MSSGEATSTREGVREVFSRNPNTGELLGSAPIHTEPEVRQAVERARVAQREWGARTLKDRLRVLQQVQDALVEQSDEIASLVALEVGKGELEALVADVFLVLTSLAGYARLAPRALRTRRLAHGLAHITKRTYVVHEPLGVVAVVSPFNFPVLLSMQSVFAALIAGNAVVHKPSEFAPLTALKIEEVFSQTDLPSDLFQVVIGNGQTGWELIHAGVDHVSFVGSSRTGRKIGAAAGEQLISSTLELGGNNAMIVCEDAPLERAVYGALTFAFANNGQMCGAISRLYVQNSVADEFIDQLTTRMSDWRVSTQVAPGASEITALADERFLAHVEGNVQQALSEGARAVTGGERLEGTQAPVFKPTVLVDTHPDMEVVREETFGPVISVMRFGSDEEAIELANATDYGLTASVWTKDTRRAWRISRALEVGTVAVNDHLWPFFAPEVPWGGVKASGIGRVGGEWGLLAMTQPKVVSYDRLNLRREFYWHPASARIHKVFQQLIRILYSTRPALRLKSLGRLVGLILRPNSSD